MKRRSADGSVGSPHVRVGNCQASNKAESPVERPGFLFLRLKRTPSRKARGFLLCGVYLPPVALRLPGLQKRTPDKVRSTASGENYAMFAPLSPFNAK
ncbi:hypothetical protein CI678_11520 [Klebsiella pneumoniae subsp. pneumoniae]|nr:hypothetical protein CI678_11520 [Klebsiella pneumoniae subsp. pneumoniae]OYE92431.1 hypothetical protein CI625_26080 [Klebsiella pneumoniae subsp. pneumoniae]OYF11420.1 hypothetical protein CI622_15070 [Klebsiella pneumoniae subsp. pneumoniae]OYF13013.1 hypothetical protein CI619_27715 [Klebsiella pneumoniae subsp. pneumoniae]OYF21125.1 hypothetical protein CI623_24090 [Klebsiella pneumoniae subsp. pneumoniae]